MDQAPSLVTITIISASLLLIGLGFLWLGAYVRDRIKSKVLRRVISWLCFALGVIFVSSATFNMVVTILFHS
jgi:uncharacterized membrane protein YfcA